MLDGLTDKDARMLASKFELSGGEIENIVRKQTVNAIIAGTDIIDIPAIIELCSRERITSGPVKKIGF